MNKKWRLKNWWFPLIITIIATAMSFFLSGDGKSQKQTIKDTTNNGIIVQGNYTQTVNFMESTGNIIEDIKDIRIVNVRDDEDKLLNAMQLVQKYFDYLNLGEYTKACSLLSLRSCDSQNYTSISDLSREKSNTINGYENIQILDSNIGNGNKKIICVKYSYRLNRNSSGNIWYFFQYYLENKEGVREINNRIPERSFQDGKGERYLEKKASEIICHGKLME